MGRACPPLTRASCGHGHEQQRARARRSPGHRVDKLMSNGAPEPAAHLHVERPRKTRRSVRTRERILQAATEVFARRGFHGARVADIAELAGIAYGLVYHHFRNKDDILAAIFAERWGEYVRYIDGMAGSAEPFREQVTHLVHFWVDTWRN